MGVDFCAQIEDGDLFDYEEEVEPILAVLCGKTLEHSRMEELEEEELRVMREQYPTRKCSTTRSPKPKNSKPLSCVRNKKSREKGPDEIEEVGND